MTAVRHRAEGRRRADRRKLLAIASAFSILGVGAGITTLASWTENIPLLGSGVGASNFCVAYSINGAAWVQEALTSGVPNTVPLAFPGGASLSPSTSAMASVQLATCQGSIAANVTISPNTATNAANTLLSSLQYAVAQGGLPSGCTGGTMPATSVVASQLLTTASTSSAIALPTSTWSGSPSAPTTGAVPLCFQVTLPTGSPVSLQSGTGNPSWTLNVTTS